jgi:DNA-binding GntR family transcriptional regulator
LQPSAPGRPRTLAEQAAEEIRNRIVKGQFALGEALSETAVAAELGISKTPVREAFLLLKTEGLVEILPQRGTFVFRIDGDDARKLTEFREALEIAALRLAMISDAKGLGDRLSGTAIEMSSALAKHEDQAYRDLDADFHQLIIDHADNGYLSRAYAVIAFRIQAVRYRLTASTYLDARTLKDHHTIARLISRGESDKATEVLRIHIRRALEDYANTLASTQDSDLVAPRARMVQRNRRALNRS